MQEKLAAPSADWGEVQHSGLGVFAKGLQGFFGQRDWLPELCAPRKDHPGVFHSLK